MPLDDAEKVRVRKHLGYPQVQAAASVNFGIPKPIQTAFLVEIAMQNLIEGAVAIVRDLLNKMDNIEDKLVDAQDRLAAIQLDSLHLREDETDKLEREYVRWGFRLADVLGVPVYAYSLRYRNATFARGGSIPVRG